MRVRGFDIQGAFLTASRLMLPGKDDVPGAISFASNAKVPAGAAVFLAHFQKELP